MQGQLLSSPVLPCHAIMATGAREFWGAPGGGLGSLCLPSHPNEHVLKARLLASVLLCQGTGHWGSLGIQLQRYFQGVGSLLKAQTPAPHPQSHQTPPAPGTGPGYLHLTLSGRFPPPLQLGDPHQGAL